MKSRNDKLKPTESQIDNEKEKDLPGYPIYPENEDIYKQFQEEEDINPENISKTKAPNSDNTLRRKDLDEENIGKDLDIPGSKLDDSQEDIGREDEENNYYSLGGDAHLDLEEDKGV